MGSLSGKLAVAHGAMVYLKVMQSPDYVEALKRAGLPYATPFSVLGLLDTGASCSALDAMVVAALDRRWRRVPRFV